MRPYWPVVLAACLSAVLLILTIFKLTHVNGGQPDRMAIHAYLKRLQPLEIDVQSVRQKLRSLAKGGTLSASERVRLVTSSSQSVRSLREGDDVPRQYSRYHA